MGNKIGTQQAQNFQFHHILSQSLAFCHFGTSLAKLSIKPHHFIQSFIVSPNLFMFVLRLYTLFRRDIPHSSTKINRQKSVIVT